MLKIYTKTGDDGTTGLLYGGRVRKDAAVMQINGAVDEAQAAMGVARAETTADSELDTLLSGLERDLYVLMAEVATDPSHRSKLVAGKTLVTAEMVARLEQRIDELIGRFDMPADFVVPGANRASAALDLADDRAAGRTARRVGTDRIVGGRPLPQPSLGPPLGDGPLGRGRRPPARPR